MLAGVRSSTEIEDFGNSQVVILDRTSVFAGLSGALEYKDRLMLRFQHSFPVSQRNEILRIWSIGLGVRFRIARTAS